MIAVLSIMTVVVHTFLVWRQLRMHIIGNLRKRYIRVRWIIWTYQNFNWWYYLDY